MVGVSWFKKKNDKQPGEQSSPDIFYLLCKNYSYVSEPKWSRRRQLQHVIYKGLKNIFFK